jgi:predicted DNA-binding transcriptional regulator YafY
VSLRQLDRDLVDLEENYLRNFEKLIKSKSGKRIYYSINKRKPKERKLDFKDFSIIDLLHVSDNPQLFSDFKKQILFFTRFKKALFEVFSENQNIVQKDIVFKTNFHELRNDKTFISNILKVYQSIYEEKYIQVKEVNFDATNENPDLKSNKLVLMPIKIIFHRGDYYLFSKHKDSYKIFEIGQLKDVTILEKGFNLNKYSNDLAIELKNRFGVTNNMDDKIYPIKLQFSESTGNYIQKFFWHPTQRITKHKKNFILEMECGISRELVGWIFQWMNNVKILEPKILADIYKETLHRIIGNQQVEYLESVNIFENKI